MPELKNITLWQMLCDTASKYPDRDAMVSREVRLKYSVLIRKSEEIAGALLKVGVKKGTHVGTWLNDKPETIVYMFALWCIGAIPVPICTSFVKNEFEGCIKSADIEYLITEDYYRDNCLLKLCREQTLIPAEKIFTADEYPKSDFASINSLIKSSACSKDELKNAEEAVLPSDTDTILFTSGSTGSSKPVVTTHFSRVNTAYTQAAAYGTSQKDKFCSVLPMFHCFSLTASILAALASGACLCFPKSRRSADILQTIAQERCTVLTAVPTLFSALVRRQKEVAADLSSLRTGMIGGSTYTPEFFREICDVLGFTLLPSLGQTEATAGLTAGLLTDSIEKRSTTLGIPFDGVELRIMKNGSELPDGESGEICIQGFNVMQGYYKNSEATAAAIDGNGWLHTGDLGYLKEGYLYYTGRLKDIIIRGGENIFPGEIENILESDARISQAEVIGVPDPHYIEEVCACVVPTEACTITEDDVRSIVAEKLSGYKVPRYVEMMSSFPLTNTGKIDRKKLTASITSKLASAE